MLAQIDDWLTSAVSSIPSDGLDRTLLAVEQRLSHQPSPMEISNQRDGWRSMCCAGFAALLGFWAMGGINDIAQAQAGPTWIAAPSQSSPYSLLIGR